MKVNLRVQYGRYEDDAALKKHIEFIKRHKAVIDEISLFTECSHHGYWTLDYAKKLSERLKYVIEEHKKAGIKSVGLNVLCTIGHLDEAWDFLSKPPMQTMVGADGRVSLSCLCPNSDEYRKYIAERYKILSESSPDFIWIDDDFRITNHGPAGPCYCSTCIDKFNKAYALSETFETLTEKVENEPLGDVAKKWNKFWTDSFTDVAKIIKNAIHSVNPSIKIGLMTGFEGVAYKEWFDAFEAVKGRPGGGFYTDAEPEWIELKLLLCEMQLESYPDFVTERQYEVENFPYEDMCKSITAQEFELKYALMSGCNGIAYNIMNYYDEDKRVDIIKENKTLLDEISKRSSIMKNCGIYCGDTFNTAYTFMRMGIPMTADRTNASAYILIGEDVYNYSDEEIKALLSKSVLIDSRAMDILTDKGFGKYLGVKAKNYYDNGTMEIFTDNELNKGFEGYKLNSFVNFDGMRKSIAALESLNDEIKVISKLYSINGNELGEAMTLYKNSLGGYVAVLSYIFTERILKGICFASKRSQLLNLFDKIVPGGIPVRVNVSHKIVPVIRENENGFILMLSNMSLDKCENFTVDIKADSCMRIEDGGKLCPVKTEKIDKGIRIFIDEIKPFECIVLTDK